MEFHNISGEKVSGKDISKLVKRIRKLSPIEIDDLWDSLGFRYDQRQNKALPLHFIDEIMNSDEEATKLLAFVFEDSNDSPKDFIKSVDKKLGTIEHEKKFYETKQKKEGIRKARTI